VAPRRPPSRFNQRRRVAALQSPSDSESLTGGRSLTHWQPAGPGHSLRVTPRHGRPARPPAAVPPRASAAAARRRRWRAPARDRQPAGRGRRPLQNARARPGPGRRKWLGCVATTCAVHNDSEFEACYLGGCCSGQVRFRLGDSDSDSPAPGPPEARWARAQVIKT
jgi:hypothetical protein